jgi:hypothetical protein
MKTLLAKIMKMMADAKAAGKEVTEADLTAALVLTPEDVTAYLETADGLKVLQPRLDAHFTKSLKTWQEKSMPDVLEAEIKKRFPGETPEQKQIRELQIKQTESERKAVRADLRSKALSVLTAKGLPVELVDNFIGEDEAATTANLTGLEKVWTSKLQAAVDVVFKEKGREPQKGGGGGDAKDLGSALAAHYSEKK